MIGGTIHAAVRIDLGDANVRRLPSNGARPQRPAKREAQTIRCGSDAGVDMETVERVGLDGARYSISTVGIRYCWVSAQ